MNQTHRSKVPAAEAAGQSEVPDLRQDVQQLEELHQAPEDPRREQPAQVRALRQGVCQQGGAERPPQETHQGEAV